MREIYPKFYKEFKCLGGDCPNTCCQGWGVDIDKDTLLRYQNVEGPYGAKLKSILANHKQFFKLGNKCPFLSKDGLCDIQLNLGEKYLCDVCKKFPREEYQYGESIEHSLSPACIEVAELILKNGMELEIINTDKLITSYSEFDTKLYPYMFKARDFIFRIIDSNMKFDNKLKLIIEFGEYLQKNFRVYSKIDDIILKFEEKSHGYNQKFTAKIDKKFLIKLIKEYIKLDMLTPFLTDKLENLLDMIYENRVNVKDVISMFENYRGIAYFENIAKYFIYKYFLRCVYDYEMSSRIKFATYTTFIMMLLSIFDTVKVGKINENDISKNLEMVSREIEHNEDNIKKLNKIFKKEGSPK